MPDAPEEEKNFCGNTITLVAGGAIASEIDTVAEALEVDVPTVPSKVVSLKTLEQNLLV